MALAWAQQVVFLCQVLISRLHQIMVPSCMCLKDGCVMCQLLLGVNCLARQGRQMVGIGLGRVQRNTRRTTPHPGWLPRKSTLSTPSPSIYS